VTLPPLPTAGPRELDGPVRRAPLLAQGLAAAAVGGLLLLVELAGPVPFVAALLVAQLVLLLALLALVEAPADLGVLVVSAASAVAADVVVLRSDGRVGGLAGVVALAFVAGLLHQLGRRGRSRVTESLSYTLLAVLLTASLACLGALRELAGGQEALAVGLAAVATALLAGRVGDRLAPRPALAVGATRGWPGLLLALGVGALVGAVVGGHDGRVGGTAAALLGLAVAAAAALGDLAVDLGAAELRRGRRDARRAAALLPVTLLLPYAVLGPVGLLAGRLVLR